MGFQDAPGDEEPEPTRAARVLLAGYLDRAPDERLGELLQGAGRPGPSSCTRTMLLKTSRRTSERA